MSTTKKHIEEIEQRRYTYEQIEASVHAMDDDGAYEEVTAPTRAQLLQNLASIWRGVRPILTVVAMLPLLRPSWRDALQFFVTTIEQIVATTQLEGDFKAGKDL